MFIPMAMHSSDFKLRLVASVPYFHCKLIFTVIIAVATDIYKFSNLGLLSRALGFRDFSNKAKLDILTPKQKIAVQFPI